MYVLNDGVLNQVIVRFGAPEPDETADHLTGETILRVQGPGECLGELSLIDGEPRSASAVAIERVEAMALYRADFLALVEHRPSVAQAVMNGLVGLVRVNVGKGTNLGTHDTRGQVWQLRPARAGPRPGIQYTPPARAVE